MISSTLMPTSLPRQVRELVAQLVDLGALLADHDARTTGVQRDDDLPRLALDHDVRDRRVAEARLQILAQQLVFAQQRGQIAAGVVARLPVLRDAEAEADRMCLLSHYRAPSLADDDLDVARPLANRRRASHRGRREALELRAFVHDRALDVQRVDVERRVAFARRLLGVRDGRACSVFSICFAACFFENCEVGERLVHVLAADLVDHEPHLVRRLARGALDRAGFSGHGLLASAAGRHADGAGAAAAGAAALPAAGVGAFLSTAFCPV